MPCERCGSEKDVDTVCVFGGRDYPPRPPEYAALCADCQDEERDQNRPVTERSWDSN